MLTDFHGSSGAAVREPHNSYISIVARTGLFGATCWVLMMLSLVQRWHLCFRRCRSLGWRLGENRLMALMVYFICMWVLAIGEDAFEKPYNIIPFYFLWGITLRFSLLLSDGEIGPEAERSRHQEPTLPAPRARTCRDRPTRIGRAAPCLRLRGSGRQGDGCLPAACPHRSTEKRAEAARAATVPARGEQRRRGRTCDCLTFW